MISRIHLAAVILALGCLSAQGLRGAPDAVRAEQVDQIFAEWDQSTTPGVALAVIMDGEIVYQRGYGMADLESGAPISNESVFYIASVSKQFTAMSVLLLAEQGRLSLDDNIRQHVPEFPDYGHVITVRQLIHHTSGIRDYLSLWSLAGNTYSDAVSEEAVMEMLIRQKKLNYTPGDQWLYNNSGYFLLSVIVERVSGQTLARFAHEHIFKPLGMRNTHFHDDHTHVINNLALGHYARGDNGYKPFHTSFALVGSGGVYSTTSDLYLWDQNLYHNQLGQGDQDLINQWMTPGALNSGKKTHYASGLVVGRYRGLENVNHSGSLIGYRSHYLAFPRDRFSVICLTNLPGTNPESLAQRVADLYLFGGPGKQGATKTGGPPQTAPPQPRHKKRSGHELASYTGRYHSEELQVDYRVITRNGKLLLAHRNAPGTAYEAIRRDTFRAGTRGVQFTRDDGGRVSGFTLSSDRARHIEFVRKDE